MDKTKSTTPLLWIFALLVVALVGFNISRGYLPTKMSFFGIFKVDFEKGSPPTPIIDDTSKVAKRKGQPDSIPPIIHNRPQLQNYTLERDTTVGSNDDLLSHSFPVPDGAIKYYVSVIATISNAAANAKFAYQIPLIIDSKIDTTFEDPSQGSTGEKILSFKTKTAVVPPNKLITVELLLRSAWSGLPNTQLKIHRNATVSVFFGY